MIPGSVRICVCSEPQDMRCAQSRVIARSSLVDRVVRETLRLYPPAWWADRARTAPVELAIYGIPAGTLLVFNAYRTLQLTAARARRQREPARLGLARLGWTAARILSRRGRLAHQLPMKISELSNVSQLPVASIKFYIREGLLPAGQRTSKTQAEYGPRHVERLSLIRALQDAAGLRLDAIALALRAADKAKEDFVIAAIDALERPAQRHEIAHAEAAAAERGVLTLSKRRGWKVSGEDESVRHAVLAAAYIKRWYPDNDFADLDPYFDAVGRIAEHEVPDDWAPHAEPEAALRYALLGTVLFEPFILALRRVAHVARIRALRKPTRAATKRSRTRGASASRTARAAKRKHFR